MSQGILVPEGSAAAVAAQAKMQRQANILGLAGQIYVQRVTSGHMAGPQVAAQALIDASYFVTVAEQWLVEENKPAPVVTP